MAGGVVALAGLLGVVASAGANARNPEAPVAGAPGPHPVDVVPVVDTSRIPAPTIDADVRTVFGNELGADEVCEELLRLLDIERLAFESGDATLLPVADHGRRLSRHRDQIDQNQLSWQTFEFDTMHVGLTRVGGQGGIRIGVDGTGQVTTITSNDGDSTTEEFALTFVLRRGAGDRWFLADVIDLD